MPMMFGHFEVVASTVICISVLGGIWIPSTCALTTSDPQTDDYEEITEVYTEVVAITTEQTSEQKDEEGKPGYPGNSFMALKFTINNRDMSNPDKIEVEIVTEVSSFCRAQFENFLSVIVLSLQAGSVITELAVLFSSQLKPEEQTVVVQTFFEAVELNGTIGILGVTDLYVIDKPGEQLPSDDKPGKYRRIEDACDITSCIHDKMICSSDGVVCFSSCEDNKDFCQNNSTCTDKKSATNFIGCNCVDGYRGDQCEIPPKTRHRPYSENVFIGIIVAAAVVLFCLLLLLAFLLCSKIRKSKSDHRSDIYPADNVIALEMSNDYYIVGGVGTQTEDSFLLTQYMLNGIPPKPGFSHSVMQTTDSFLLAKSQGRVLHGKRGKTAPAPSQPKNNTTDNDKSREKAVDVTLERRSKPTEKVKGKAEDGGVDNKGAVNEGFVKDEDVVANKQAKETEDELKDPKKIVKV